jgi:hypothetical protein
LTGSQAVQFASMSVYLSGSIAPMPITGGIYSDSSGSPGSSLATFNAVMSSPLLNQLYTFQTTIPFTMQASTGYWFVLTSVSALPITWQTDGSNGGLGATMTADPEYTSMGTKTSLGGLVWIPSTYIPAVEIAVANAPEPGTLTLMAAGILGLGLMRRRRRA